MSVRAQLVPRSFGVQAAISFAACLHFSACKRASSDREGPKAESSASPTELPSSPAPPVEQLELLHLPESEDALPPPLGAGFLPSAPPSFSRCPAEMVDIAGAFCIDRYEGSLVDYATETRLSPHYAPKRVQIRAQFERYRGEAARGLGLSVPQPSALELSDTSGALEPAARSVAGVIPHAYLDFETAQAACARAGKRLCALDEWVRACRGASNRKFPYGNQYQEGACNVFREAHPASLLHGDASRGHLDPRLGLVAGPRGPLLRPTGGTPSCRSVWGSDAIYDMVGNLDERVADGSFVGGFFSRGTREGCDSRIASHAREYFDYSIGLRCCKEPR